MKDQLLIQLASTIRRHRARLGFSQSRAAACIGSKLSTYASYEEARAAPPLAALMRLATLFACTLDELTGYAPDASVQAAVAALPPRAAQRPLRPARRTAPAVAPPATTTRPFVTWP